MITENLMGIKRVKGSHQKAKKPLLIDDLKLIIKAIDKEKIRDKALILVGFAGGFRRSELVNINNEDIEFVPEGVKILIKRSKTDQSGEGSVKAIPYFDNQEFCPVIAFKKYISSNSNKESDDRIFKISDSFRKCIFL